MIRKMLHNILNVKAARTYVPYQDLENKHMLTGFLDQPDLFVDHLRRYTNSLTTQMVFGFRTISIDDPKLKQLFEGFEKFCEVTNTSTAALLDLFPILKLLPDFMLPLRKYSRDLHKHEKELYVGHWLDTKKKIKNGKSKVCPLPNRHTTLWLNSHLSHVAFADYSLALFLCRFTLGTRSRRVFR